MLITMIMDTQDLSGLHEEQPNANGHATPAPAVSDDLAFGYPRDFLHNRFVYLVISPRARGLSVGVNLNPVVKCNLNCVYCEVDRRKPPLQNHLDVEAMANELTGTLRLACA